MPVVVTTVKLSPELHFRIGVAAAAKRQSSQGWMVAAFESAIERQAKSDPILASALRAKSTPPQIKSQST